MSGIVIGMIGGNCPVQAEGTIDGEKFYFRARGDSWSIEIGTDDPCCNPDAWRYEEDYGDGPFDAGWMSEKDAMAMIEKGAALWRAKDAGLNASPTASNDERPRRDDDSNPCKEGA